LALLLLLSLTACGGNTDSSDLPAEPLSEADLVAAVKANLGVPDVKGISYTISEKFYWEAGERHYRHMAFYEYGDLVATASVDPTSGELLRSIYTYTAPATTPIRDAFIRVLNSEQVFAVKNYSTGKAEQRKLHQFSFDTGTVKQALFIPARYAFVDMNQDSVFEMVIADKGQQFYLILRYSGGGVVGYVVPYRGLLELRTDGRFRGTEGAGISSIGRMSFHNLDYTVTELAYQDQQKGEYRLDGATADKASVEAYYSAWKSVDTIRWFTF
jgi:hypothetical protein